MDWHSDSAFRMGHTHSVCEDYARAFDCPDKMHGWDQCGYIMVSDGCSSSPDTDCGSRLLVNAASQVVMDGMLNPYSEGFYSSAAIEARSAISRGELPDRSLDATLLVAYAGQTLHEDGSPNAYQLNVGVYGDGVVAYKHRCGSLVIHSVEYQTGYPSYPSYLLNRQRFHGWKEHIKSDEPTKSTWVIDADGSYNFYKGLYVGVSFAPKMSDVPDSGDPKTFVPIRIPYPIAELEYVALMSDGVEAVIEQTETETSKSQKSVKMMEVVQELLSFKTFAGEFVQRRMNRFMKDCKKLNWLPLDDLSLAVLHFGADEK